MNIALNIDRQMVGLFFEIKRNMPFEDRDSMKIASPDIGDLLINIYQQSDSNSLRQLIEQFMQRAGGPWVKKLSTQQTQKVHYYLGQLLMSTRASV